MRRALGLDGQTPPPRPSAASAARTAESAAFAGRHRHRFVSDGEVPVVMVQSRPDQPAASRLEEATAALASERGMRERAERSLTAAQAAIRDLQTKLAHATLARDEAVAALHTAQEELAAMRAHSPAPMLPEPLSADAAPTTPVTPRRRGRPPKAATAKLPAKPRQRMQKPVKWWVKGWRETAAD